MAYVLGFFCADGAMTINPRGSKYIDFCITDGDLLLKIKKCFDAKQSIIRKDPVRGKAIYRLQIGSKVIFNDLTLLGLTPKKTFRFEMPPIPNLFLSHFVRGYFDGDGNVWSGMIHKERKTPTTALRTVFTSGNKKFLEQLACILKERIGVSGFFTATGGASQLVYSIRPSLSLYRFMYTDIENNLFLNRKKAVFEKYISNAAVV